MRTMSRKRHGMGFTVASARAVSVALIVSVLWFLANPAQVHACKCAEPGSACEELDESSAVFAGRVVSVRHSYDPDATSYSSQDHTTVGFEVSTVWKGTVHAEMYVTTPPTHGSCGVPFVEGEEYIVYGRDSAYADDGYTVHICSRTALLSEAQADLDTLGAGDAPLEGTNGSSPEQSQDATVAVTRDGTSGRSPQQSQDDAVAGTQEGTRGSSPEQSQDATVGGEWVIVLVVAATVLVAGGVVVYGRARRR